MSLPTVLEEISASHVCQYQDEIIAKLLEEKANTMERPRPRAYHRQVHKALTMGLGGVMLIREVSNVLEALGGDSLVKFVGQFPLAKVKSMRDGLVKHDPEGVPQLRKVVAGVLAIYEDLGY